MIISHASYVGEQVSLRHVCQLSARQSVAFPYYEIKDRAAIPMTMAMIPIFW